MTDKKEKLDVEKSNEVSDKNYKKKNKDSDSQVEKGLTETHVNVEDDYMDGTIDRKRDDTKD